MVVERAGSDLIPARGRYVVTSGGNRRRASRPSRSKLARLRRAVYERDGFMCVACWYVPTDDQIRRFYDRGHNPGRLQLDHAIPYRLGGEFAMDNLQTMCEPCNIKKGARVDGMVQSR